MFNVKTETVTNGDLKLEYFQVDPDYHNDPRQFENMTRFVWAHGKYDLPQEIDGFNFKDYAGWDEAELALRAEFDAAIVLTVWMYDHSGVSFSCSIGNSKANPWSCPWDSGIVGFAVVTNAEQQASGFSIEECERNLRREVTEYSEWTSGQIYRFEITRGDEFVSTGEIIGWTEAKAEAEWCLKQAVEAAA
jgi:hypothetical protein